MSKASKPKATTKGVTPAVKKYVKKVVKNDSKKKDEVKYHTTTVTPIDVPNTAGVMKVLTDVGQAAGAASDTTRLGDNVMLKSLDARIGLENFGTSPVATRLIAFQWHIDDTITAPNSGDVLTANSPSGAVADAYSQYNHDSIKGNKLTILYDKTFELDPYHPRVSIRKKIDLLYAKKKIQYFSGGIKGMHNIYLLAISSDPVVAGVTQVQLGHSTRMFFIDP